jgi:hypothetical protein
MDKKEKIMFNEEEEYGFDLPEPKSETEKKTKTGNTTNTEGWQLDLQNKYYLGTTSFALIPDTVLIQGADGTKKHRFFREINFGVGGKIINPESSNGWTYNVQIPDVNDFKCQLTPEQRALINHLRDLSKKFAQLTSYENRNLYPTVYKLVNVKVHSLQFFTFGKILRMELKSGDKETPLKHIGHIRTLTFNKGSRGTTDFGTVFIKAIKNKNMNMPPESKWQFNYFGRKAGQKNHCVCANSDTFTGDNGTRYSIGLSFEECLPFDLTQADLDNALNLDSRIYNIEKFDEEYYHKLAGAYDHVEYQLKDMLARVSNNQTKKQEPPKIVQTNLPPAPAKVEKEPQKPVQPEPDFGDISNDDFPF